MQLPYPSTPSNPSNPHIQKSSWRPERLFGSRRIRVEHFEPPFDGCHEFNGGPDDEMRTVAQASWNPIRSSNS